MHAIFFGSVAVGFLVADHLKTPYDPIFDEAGSRYNIDSNLLRAIGRHESGFKANAVNSNTNGTKDYGVMQINQTNFDVLRLDPVSALNPISNIRAAALFLSLLKKELGDKLSTQTLISAYNQGAPRTVKSGILNLPYTQSVWWHFTLYSVGRAFA